ncbi:MAG: hypothetical protein ACLFVD_02660 [Dehalococcoidia bacterium]
MGTGEARSWLLFGAGGGRPRPGGLTSAPLRCDGTGRTTGEHAGRDHDGGVAGRPTGRGPARRRTVAVTMTIGDGGGNGSADGTSVVVVWWWWCGTEAVAR